MLCQLLSVNRRARFEFSVFFSEICIQLISYLDSPSACSLPNYPFLNLKTILAKYDSSITLNFHNLAHWAYSHSKVISEFQRSPCPYLAHAKAALSCKPMTWRYVFFTPTLFTLCDDSNFISLQTFIIFCGLMSRNLLRTFLHTFLWFSLPFALTQPIQIFFTIQNFVCPTSLINISALVIIIDRS